MAKRLAGELGLYGICFCMLAFTSCSSQSEKSKAKAVHKPSKQVQKMVEYFRDRHDP